jgi:hypothetical protein
MYHSDPVRRPGIATGQGAEAPFQAASLQSPLLTLAENRDGSSLERIAWVLFQET